MKKLATSLFVLLLTAAATLSASAQTIRRVSATATGTNIYATFALAQTAATAGDIIQLEPGTYNFDITLSKNLTVVGPGSQQSELFEWIDSVMQRRPSGVTVRAHLYSDAEHRDPRAVRAARLPAPPRQSGMPPLHVNRWLAGKPALLPGALPASAA